jgi:hypothetical protein
LSNYIKIIIIFSQGKEYLTLVAQVTDPSVVYVTGEEGRETTELTTALNTWDKARRFVVSHVLKDGKNRKQSSFLEGEECVTRRIRMIISSLSPTNQTYRQKRLFYSTKNEAMPKITSKKPNTIYLYPYREIYEQSLP